jgi:hypothetical protein
MARLFISVERLDNWTAEGRAILVGDRMTLNREQTSFRMQPAVHFIKVAGNDDLDQLVGLVKSVTELESIGAELMESSVIFEDNAYEVINGFLGEPLPS